MIKIRNTNWRFLFLIFAVTIVVYGFFISNTYAEEEIIKEDVIVIDEVTENENDYTIIENDILQDTIWTKEGSPYVINESILVDSNTTLTIEEGVVVKFMQDYNPYSGVSIYILGKIIAEGTDDEPIYFTSNYDDTGGSTDSDEEYCDFVLFDEYDNPMGDEVCESIDWNDPNVGDWGGLFFSNSTDSEFKNVFIRYATDALSFESSNVNFENLYISESNSGLSGGIKSNINIKGGEFEGLEDAFTFYDDSFISVEDILVRDVSYGFTFYVSTNYKNKNPEIEVFDNSILKITNLDLSCREDGITIFNNYHLDIEDSQINCSSHGITLFNEVKADINNVKISGANDAGIIAFNNILDTSIINIINSEIKENGYGFIVWNTKNFNANRNSIHTNFIKGVLTFQTEDNILNPIDLYFTNNWWGSDTGPAHSSNVPGHGDSVSDFVLFSPWLVYDQLVKRRNPVILIPGITATYLNRNYGDKNEIWPDLSRLLLSPNDSFLNDLALNTDGTENGDYPIVAGDIIRKIVTVDVYDGLIKELIADGYIEGEDLFVFPYDWRFSTESISKKLKEKIEEIILKTGQDKVDIVAHSMGGLVAKNYIKDNGKDRVDQLIFLGSPQLGSPKAFRVLMFGDNMGFKKLFLGLDKLRAKFISQNMPSVYELLPSEKYLTLNGNYVNNLLNENIPIGLDYEGVKNYLIDSGRNPQMFSYAESLHSSLDDFDLSEIESYNFVGCSIPTIGKINLKQKDSWLGKLFNKKEDYQIIYTDGDSTVPLVSSFGTIGSDIFYVNGVTHESLPSAKGVKENILAVLNNESLVFGDVFQDSDRYCGIKGYVVSTHSPVLLHIYDEEGNHTGPNEDGNMEYEIVGVSYDSIEDVNYAFLPEGGNYEVVTKAIDTGGFNLKIEKQNGEVITNTYVWNLIPQPSIRNTGEILIGEDYDSKSYKLKIDEDGDGVFEKDYIEGFDGTSIAEKATEKKEESRNYRITGSIPKKDINQSQLEPIFVGNITIPKQINIIKDLEVINISVEDNKNQKEINIIEEEEKTSRIDNKSLLANTGNTIEIDYKILTIISGSILVLLFAIKLIFKIK